jgi:hypothetical protein
MLAISALLNMPCPRSYPRPSSGILAPRKGASQIHCRPIRHTAYGIRHTGIQAYRQARSARLELGPMEVRGSMRRAVKTLRADARSSSFPLRWLLAILGLFGSVYVVLKLGSYVGQLWPSRAVGQGGESQYHESGRAKSRSSRSSRSSRGKGSRNSRNSRNRNSEDGDSSDRNRDSRKFYIYPWPPTLTDL